MVGWFGDALKQLTDGKKFTSLNPGNEVPDSDPNRKHARTYVKFWDADWNPNSGPCLLVSEDWVTVFKYDEGNTVSYLGLNHTVPGTHINDLYPDAVIVDWKPDGSYAIITGDAGIFWKWTNNQNEFTCLIPNNPMPGIIEFEWSPKGKIALAGGVTRLWKYSEKSNTFKTLWINEDEDKDCRIRGIAWQPECNYAIVSGWDGTVLVYDPDGDTIHEVDCKTNLNFEKSAWKPGGNYAIGLLNKRDLIQDLFDDLPQ